MGPPSLATESRAVSGRRLIDRLRLSLRQHWIVAARGLGREANPEVEVEGGGEQLTST